MDKNELIFYDKLKDIFIGGKIEGNSGFVNLIRIKSKYFDAIFKELKKEIDDKTKELPDFKEEIYDKLNTFFQIYFSESGSIYFTYTPLKSKVYDKIYTNQDDVILFWKTRMLYYVKTDKLWNNLSVEYKKDNLKYDINFDVSKLEQKSGNEKKEIVYELKEINDKKISFYVLYSKKGKQTYSSNILREFKNSSIHLNDDDLDNIFRIFEKQNEVDYFINKDAKSFLKEQFDLWLKNYIFDDESDFSEKRLRELKLLKEVVYKIINFVSQFEDELVKIWNKPKFVLNSNYIITLDRIFDKGGIELIKKIFDNEGIEEQIKEWRDLGIIECEFDKNSLFTKNLKGEILNEKYKFLPIDTKYLKDLELSIISLFDDLDESLDGWLIHSENYQALNTILPKFKEKVQTIYIDPPYNTGSDEFIYKDKFQNASWLTMLENRLNISKTLMAKEGNFFISIGDTLKSNIRIHSESRLGLLCDQIFGENNFVANFVRKSGTAPRQDNKYIANYHDYIFCYSKNIDNVKINRKEADNSRLKYTDEHIKERGPCDLNQLDRGSQNYSESLDYPIIIEKGKSITIIEGETFKKIPAPERIEIWPGGDPKDKIWIFRWSKQKVEWGIKNDFIVFRKINFKWKIYYKEYKLVDNTNKPRERTNPYDSLILDYQNELGTSEIDNLFGKRLFEYPKPSELIKYLLKIGTNRDSLVLDFFAGSGTTAHAVMKLNKEDSSKRKFILVEMADYFNTIIIPRIKKVAYSFNWKDGKPQDNNGRGIFFKYYDLEQYEQTLKKCDYKPSEPFFDLDDKTIYEQYVFMKDHKLLDSMKIDYQNNKIRINFDDIYSNIDIAETLSNIKGKRIKRITENSVVLKDDKGNEEEIRFDNIDFKTIKPLIWW